MCLHVPDVGKCCPLLEIIDYGTGIIGDRSQEAHFTDFVFIGEICSAN